MSFAKFCLYFTILLISFEVVSSVSAVARYEWLMRRRYGNHPPRPTAHIATIAGERIFPRTYTDNDPADLVFDNDGVAYAVAPQPLSLHEIFDTYKGRANKPEIDFV